MYQTVDETVDADVVYKKGAPHPLLRAFYWRQRRFDITRINLVHPKRNGETTFLCYSVSCNGNDFRLRLDTKQCRWVLDAIYVEG